MSGPLARLVTDDEGQVLLAEAADVPLNPASLTKLMVLYLVFRDLDLTRMVEVPASAVVGRRPGRVPQSNMGLKAGQQVSVCDLVLGMIVPSANDAAVTVAHLFGAETFVERLNTGAAALGLTATRFVTPSGLGEGTTTARDMATLARRLWQDFPAWRSLFSVGSFVFNGRTRRNTNDLLFTFPGMRGLKTGSTATLRRNLATVVEREGRTLFGIVLNAADKAERDRAMQDALERNMVLAEAPIWTVAQLSKALGMEKTAFERFGTQPIQRVDVDPNTCAPGSLFLHRRIRDEEMESMDQAQGIVQAVKCGASFVITDLPQSELPADIPAVFVPDRGAALRNLARDARARFKGTVVGITGSYGKTTTKDMLVHSLSGFGKSYGTLGNYNELDGVMMTVASIPQDCRFAAIEICSTHLGSLRPKAREVRPDISILTTIGHSHIGNYPSRYDIFRDKFDIFSDMSGPKVVLIGREALDLDRAHDNLTKNLMSRIITVGRTGMDDIQLVDVRLEPGKSHATYRVQDRVTEVTIARPGIQFAVAAQFALAVGLAEGCDLDVIAESLASYRPASNQRGARWRVNVGGRGGIVEVMDDSQNSAPESIRALLEYTKIRKPRKKILVFGDMLELGEHEERLHDSVLPDIKNAGLDLFVGVGEQATRMSAALKNHVPSVAFDDSLQAVRYLFHELKGGELIVLKGSGRMNLRQVLLRLSTSGHRARVEENWFIEQVDAT